MSIVLVCLCFVGTGLYSQEPEGCQMCWYICVLLVQACIAKYRKNANCVGMSVFCCYWPVWLGTRRMSIVLVCLCFVGTGQYS